MFSIALFLVSINSCGKYMLQSVRQRVTNCVCLSFEAEKVAYRPFYLGRAMTVNQNSKDAAGQLNNELRKPLKPFKGAEVGAAKPGDNCLYVHDCK